MNGFMKKKVHRSWRQITVLILCSLGFTTLGSCYVTVENDRKYDIYGDVKGNVDGTEQTIEGIAVALYKTGGSKKITLTDSNGWYEFRDLQKGTYTITYTDIDGDKNGSFNQKEVDIVLNGDYTKSVTLTAKN